MMTEDDNMVHAFEYDEVVSEKLQAQEDLRKLRREYQELRQDHQFVQGQVKRMTDVCDKLWNADDLAPGLYQILLDALRIEAAVSIAYQDSKSKLILPTH